jgi:hypothetical protein
VDDELYRRLVDEVQPSSMSLDVRVHCILEQVQDAVNAKRAAAAAAAINSPSSFPAAAGATTAAATIADTIAAKTRRDVADFCDYVLAQLDGTQDQVFEAARKRRHKAAEAADPTAGREGGRGAGQGAETTTADGPRAPLADATYLRLVPATTSTIDPDALLLGVPLRRIEGRVRRALHTGALKDGRGFVVARTDLPNLTTLEQATKLFRHLLSDRAGLSEGDAQSVLNARTQAQLFTHEELRERLVDALRLEPDSQLYKATCADGSYVLAVVHSIPAERRRYKSQWRTFHGGVSFPQWLAWSEFAKAEHLFYYPPPRDDDDFDEPEDQPEEEAEEDEEEEEVGVDEDGEPIMRKKPRKVVIYPPEFTTKDVTLTEQLRRRATYEQLRARLALAPEGEPEELLLADNHTANLSHIEQTLLYPSDGAIVSVQTVTANQRTVHCTVHNDNGVSFGFRAALVDESRHASSSTSLPQQSSTTAVKDASSKSPKVSPRGKPSEAVLGAADANIDPAVTSHEPQETVPSSAVEPSGVNTIIAIQDDASIHISTWITGPAGFADSRPRGRRESTIPPATLKPSTPASDAAKRDGDATAVSAPSFESMMPSSSSPASPHHHIAAVVRCVLSSGVTIEANPAGSIRLITDGARESPVTVYNPLTRQITRISASEVSRTVLPDGTVMCAYEDNVRMNIFANGNTAVYYEGFWLITNAAGRRVLKEAATGKVTPVVVSLVTSNTDTETLSKLTTREDGVVTVQYDDGKMLAQHIDGTRMWRDAGRTVVDVEADGLPRVLAVFGAGLDAKVPLGQRAKLVVRDLGDFTLTLVPHEFVSIVHPASGFSGTVDLRSLLLHCDPSLDSNARYVLDLAYGGLRIVDQSGARSMHVTPLGRTVVRPVGEDQPVEPTQEPGIKQVVDVFMRPEAINPRYVRAAAAAGRHLDESLHMMPDVPECRVGAAAAGAANGGVGGGAPRSRQLRDKESGCVGALRKAMPPAAAPAGGAMTEAPASIRPPLLFVCGSYGCLELVRRRDMAALLGSATHRSNLLFTDVHREPVAAMHDEDADMDANGVVTPSGALSITLPGSAAGAEAGNADPNDVAAKQKRLTEYARLRESVIVSTAPPRQVARSGIPKILLDLRRASARSGPTSVSAFLQELKQGPQQQASKGAAGGGSFDDVLGGVTVAVATRHFVTVDPAVWSSSAPSGVGPTHIPSTKAGEPCYERALMHLARSIPAVIASQLSLGPAGQRMGSTTQRGRRTNTGGSRPSRDAKNRSLPPHKSGAKSGGSAPTEDAEFADQMAHLEQRERANRKPWPTPIADRHTLIAHATDKTLGNFWATDAGQAVAECVKAENHRYTAAAGYRKMPVPQYVSQRPDHLSPNTTHTQPSHSDTGADKAGTQRQAGQPQAPPAVPAPPRQPRPPQVAAATTAGASAALAVASVQMGTSKAGLAKHVSPAGMLTTALPPAPTATVREKQPPTVVATPHSVHFGSVVANHRYAAEVQLTNVGTAAARCRVVVESAEGAAHLSTSVGNTLLAPGMSTRLTLELAGTQSEGTFNATVTVVCVGSAVQIPVHATTVADSGRGSAGHPRAGVRVLGPALASSKFVPGTTRRARRPAEQNSRLDDSDDEGKP